MGGKLRYGPCTRDLPGTHYNWLAQFNIASISSEFTDYLMLAQSCKFEEKCCFICLTHPAACNRARVPDAGVKFCKSEPIIMPERAFENIHPLELRLPL